MELRLENLSVSSLSFLLWYLSFDCNFFLLVISFHRNRLTGNVLKKLVSNDLLGLSSTSLCLSFLTPHTDNKEEKVSAKWVMIWEKDGCMSYCFQVLLKILLFYSTWPFMLVLLLWYLSCHVIPPLTGSSVVNMGTSSVTISTWSWTSSTSPSHSSWWTSMFHLAPVLDTRKERDREETCFTSTRTTGLIMLEYLWCGCYCRQYVW